MSVIKKSTRRKLSKELSKLIEKHGAEMALALVTGILSGLVAEQADESSDKGKKSKKAKKATKATKAKKATELPAPAAKASKASKASRGPTVPDRAVVSRTRA